MRGDQNAQIGKKKELVPNAQKRKDWYVGGYWKMVTRRWWAIKSL